MSVPVNRRSILAAAGLLAAAAPFAARAQDGDAPAGGYDWLNKAVFTGTVSPPPGEPLDHVVVRVFKIV